MNPDKNHMKVYIAKYLWVVAYVLRVTLDGFLVKFYGDVMEKFAINGDIMVIMMFDTA